jgi:hypothetical protein
MNTHGFGDETIARETENGGRRRGSPWRIVGWSAAALVLLLPLVAMQFTDEVHWTGSDFAVAGVLLLAVGVSYELTVRMTGNNTYRAAVGLALAAAFLLVWVNGAVGIIGSEDNPANLMYGGVLAIGIIGTLVARFRPHGMARALVAMATAQVLVAAIALVGGLGAPATTPLQIVALNAFFIALFVGSASLFQKAARERTQLGVA